jgi:hypothetical protein
VATSESSTDVSLINRRRNGISTISATPAIERQATAPRSASSSDAPQSANDFQLKPDSTMVTKWPTVADGNMPV